MAASAMETVCHGNYLIFVNETLELLKEHDQSNNQIFRGILVSVIKKTDP
jgi:hypothetical protein